MNTKTITESGMIFGPYPEEDVFLIEKSIAYKKLKGIRIAEFILHRNGKLIFVEAKSSSPNPSNPESGNSYYKEISEKLSNALALTVALSVNRHKTINGAKEEIGTNVAESIDKGNKMILCLIIRDHQKDWLQGTQEKLIDTLRKFNLIWNVQVLVFNETMARERKLIS